MRLGPGLGERSVSEGWLPYLFAYIWAKRPTLVNPQLCAIRVTMAWLGSARRRSSWARARWTSRRYCAGVMSRWRRNPSWRDRMLTQATSGFLGTQLYRRLILATVSADVANLAAIADR
jgi:hypothetical protein